MHESGLVRRIVDEVNAKSGGKKVREVELEVGELASIEAHHLAEHVAETVDWKVHCVEVAARVVCDCGYAGRPRIVEREHDFVLFNCPRCSKTPKVDSGAEITIRKILV